MKKRLLPKVDFVFEWGLKGLKISVYILAIIFILVLLFSLKVYPLGELGAIIFRLPETSTDFLAILEGIILFIAIPFLVGVTAGIRIKKKK